MANFPLLRANLVAWGVGTPLAQAEAWALDEGRHKTINAEDGSTHAPSSQIVIGGSGLSVTGATSLSNVSGDFTLVGADKWPSFASRTLILSSPAVLVGQVGSGVGPSNMTAWPHSIDDIPGVRIEGHGTVANVAKLALPLGPRNSTLTTVEFWSRGTIATGAITTRPKFRIHSLNISGSSIPSVANVSGSQTDSHAADGSDWTDWIKTSITGIGASLWSPNTLIYWVGVEGAVDASLPDFVVATVRATYTITELRY